MKSVSCKDMGAVDCDFVAKGNSAQEVKDTMWAHAAKAHPGVLKGMSPEQQVQAAKRLEQMLA